MNSIKKNKTKIRQEAISYLLAKSWLSKEELEEINASVSHWLQNPAITLPFFNNSMRNACESFIQKYLYAAEQDSKQKSY